MSDQPTEQFSAPLSEPAPAPRGPRRAPSWLPLLLAVVGLTAAVVLAVVVIVMSLERDSPTVPSGSSTMPSSPSAPAADPAPDAPQEPVVIPPSREPGANECVDSTGEGGVLDLAAARLELDDDDVVATFELTQGLPTGTAGVGLFAEADNGKRSYQVGTVWRDGELQDFFAHEFSRDDDERLDEDDVRLEGSTITAVIPDRVIDRLGNEWSWYAYSTSEGVDVDACPGDPLSFETVRFERPNRR